MPQARLTPPSPGSLRGTLGEIMARLTQRRFLKKINAPDYILTQADCERLEEMRKEENRARSRRQKQNSPKK